VAVAAAAAAAHRKCETVLSKIDLLSSRQRKILPSTDLFFKIEIFSRPFEEISVRHMVANFSVLNTDKRRLCLAVAVRMRNVLSLILKQRLKSQQKQPLEVTKIKNVSFHFLACQGLVGLASLSDDGCIRKDSLILQYCTTKKFSKTIMVMKYVNLSCCLPLQYFTLATL
jgi:hypothetical protein